MTKKMHAKYTSLKIKMELIRTVCPIIMILIQLFIIVKIY